jgi:hypothetical protein
LPGDPPKLTINGVAFTGEGKLVRKATGYEQEKAEAALSHIGFAGCASRACAPRSMIQDPPLLDRSIRQPLDVGEANGHWRIKYGVDQALFHFGCGPHSYTENCGYFLSGDGRIETYLPGGQPLATWPSLREFLADEIARLEGIYPESERRQEQFRLGLEAADKAKRRKRTRTAEST